MSGIGYYGQNTPFYMGNYMNGLMGQSDSGQGGAFQSQMGAYPGAGMFPGGWFTPMAGAPGAGAFGSSPNPASSGNAASGSGGSQGQSQPGADPYAQAIAQYYGQSGRENSNMLTNPNKGGIAAIPGWANAGLMALAGIIPGGGLMMGGARAGQIYGDGGTNDARQQLGAAPLSTGQTLGGILGFNGYGSLMGNRQILNQEQANQLGLPSAINANGSDRQWSPAQAQGAFSQMSAENPTNPRADIPGMAAYGASPASLGFAQAATPNGWAPRPVTQAPADPGDLGYGRGSGRSSDGGGGFHTVGETHENHWGGVDHTGDNDHGGVWTGGTIHRADGGYVLSDGTRLLGAFNPDDAQAYTDAHNELLPAPNTHYGSILPLAEDTVTGDTRFALPSSMRSLANGLLDAIYGRTDGGALTQDATSALSMMASPSLGAKVDSSVLSAGAFPKTIAYHGTTSPEAITAWDLGKAQTAPDAVKAIWASLDPSRASKYASGPNGAVYRMSVNDEAPMIIDRGGRNYDPDMGLYDLRDALDRGHKSVLFKNVGDQYGGVADNLAILDPSVIGDKRGGSVGHKAAHETSAFPMKLDPGAHVPNGSHIIPADVVSALGQGNTISGAQMLHQHFGGALVPGAAPGRADTLPYNGPGQKLMLSSGEVAIPPSGVQKMGGHGAFNHFIEKTRAKATKTMKKLPKPKK
jgi:hypothetical protein